MTTARPRRAAGFVTRDLALTLVALAFAGGVPAQGTEGRAHVEQRVKLAARLVGDAATLERLAASGEAQARAQHDEGRLRTSMAEDALRRGDLALARREADEALRLLASARRLAPDAAQRRQAARQRHEQVAATLQRLIDAWRARAGVGPGADEPLDGDVFAAMGLLATAQQYAGEGRWEDGLHALRNAEQHLLTGMARVLGGREVDYTERALAPGDDWRLELGRVLALQELLPQALRELRPTPQALALAEGHGETSRRLREQAQQRMQAGDVTAALALLRESRQHGQRALSAAGLAGLMTEGGGER